MHHKIKHFIVHTFFLATCICSISQAQSLDAHYQTYDNKYGLDQKLFNGYKYYPKHTNVLGHPFLDLGRQTSKGISYKGRVFYNDNYFNQINLKYDVYQQQIVLISKDSYGADQQIVLPLAEQDSCWIQNRLFLKGNIFNSKYDIIEIVQEGSLTIVVEHFKEYKPTGSNSGYTHTYSKPKKNNLLFHNGELLWLRNNKAFIKTQPIEIQANLKTYMRKNKLKVKKAGTFQLNDLLYFTNSLIQEL